MSATTLRLAHPPRRILLVCTQRIGDVVLATPLAHSIKAAWPEAQIDFLVLPGTQGALEGNPEIRNVLAFPQRVSWRGKLAQLFQIWRRYDLSIACIPTDRARLYAWAAAARSIGFVTAGEIAWAKRHFLDVSLPFDALDTHTVSSVLELATCLGIPALAEVQPPRLGEAAASALIARLGLTGANYAVIHPSPKFRYKMWEIPHWATLIAWLRQQGLEVLLTGSADTAEAAYVADIAGRVAAGCRNLSGQLSLAETSELLRGAKVFIGPDTAVTHIAAATGIPTIALFGPSNPVKWGPWPASLKQPQNPWLFRGSQHKGNVWLIQGTGDCVPCLFEGCDRHLDSVSKCLQGIGVERVIDAVREALAP